MSSEKENISKSVSVKSLIRSNIGKLYYGVTLDKIPKQFGYFVEIERITKDIVRFIDEGEGLLLFGSYGSGKTSIAVIVAKNALYHNKTVYFIDSDEVMSSVMTNKQFEDGVSVYDRIKLVDLLIIDDLGREFGKDATKAVMENILRVRTNALRSTIITTNLAPQELKKQYGEGFYEVMMEKILPIKIQGVNFREREVD